MSKKLPYRKGGNHFSHEQKHRGSEGQAWYKCLIRGVCWLGGDRRWLAKKVVEGNVKINFRGEV